MSTITQQTVDQACLSAQKRYFAFSAREARTEFAYQLQGFVAAEVERGASLSEACQSIVELLGLLKAANPDEEGAE